MSIPRSPSTRAPLDMRGDDSAHYDSVDDDVDDADDDDDVMQTQRGVPQHEY